MAYSRETSSRSTRSTPDRGGRNQDAPADNGGGKRSSPTEKMLAYAERIAEALDMDLPQDVEDNFEACREFIDEYAVKVPPTDKQLKLAETLSNDSGDKIPADVKRSKIRLSEWIDAHTDK